MSVRVPLPALARDVYAFAVLNTISFAIVQGVPLILFLKSQGISATLLGVATALPPLMLALQLPFAHRIFRLGYKRMAVEGWTGRTSVVIGIAIVAMASPWLGPAWTLGLILPLLALYAALRGVAVAAFLPWWRGIVQPEVRGRFLAGESMSNSVASIIALTSVTAFLSVWHGPTAYALLFLMSFLAGAGGLIFLRRIPDAPTEIEPDNPTKVPWSDISSHRPFIGLIGFFALFNIAMAGASVCWITLLRDHFAANDAQMSSMPAMGAVAMGLTLLLVARMLDKVGSRPVIAVGVALWSVHLVLWGALAGGLIPFGYPALIAIQLLSGTGAALVTTASTRLLMEVVPGQGRTHFFAVYGCTQALALGILPACWGVAIDMSHNWHSALGSIALNSWSVIYPTLAVIMAISLIPLAAVPEPKAMSTRDFLTELLVNTPSRALARLIGRDR